MSKALVGNFYTKIVKSSRYLDYTYQRVLKMPVDPRKMSEVEKEVWDGFVTRFARTSDLFLSKYIRAYVRVDDPAFDGSFRDTLNRSEKLGLIDSVDPWLEIRELRNVLVHEYSDSDLLKIFEKMLRLTPLLLALEKSLSDATQGI